MRKTVGKIGAATVRERFRFIVSRETINRNRSLTVAAPIFLVCFAIGCESGWGSRVATDPFFGVPAEPKATATAPPNSPVQAASGPIPPLPATHSATGTAPMASGETATSENPRDMRIAVDTVSPAQSPSTGAARGAAPAVSVGNPEPTPPVGTTTNLSTPPPNAGLGMPAPAASPPSTSAANIRTYEDAQRILKQHRVSWQRMSGDGDDWKFSCGIPNPSNPHMNRTYQTNQSFPDLLSAMRAVIAQIEQAPH